MIERRARVRAGVRSLPRGPGRGRSSPTARARRRGGRSAAYARSSAASAPGSAQRSSTRSPSHTPASASTARACQLISVTSARFMEPLTASTATKTSLRRRLRAAQRRRRPEVARQIAQSRRVRQLDGARVGQGSVERSGHGDHEVGRRVHVHQPMPHRPRRRAGSRRAARAHRAATRASSPGSIDSSSRRPAAARSAARRLHRAASRSSSGA